jgi:hypothetical protein
MRSLVKCDINIDRSEKYDTKSKKKIFYKHPSDLGIKKSINILNKMYVFTFVRNPYDRILSAYLDKVCKHKNNYLAINKKLGRDLNSSISFEDFVEYLDIGGVYDNVHWAPQYSMLPDINYLNYIGKVEFLNQDLIYLTDILFSNSDSFVLDNYAKNPTHAKNQKETYYTQSLKSKIYELYKQDFHFLGYSKESEGCTQN